MPTLYIVATPIGNLADLTPRALETLQKVDLIAAEDTRRTRGLLQHHKLETKLISYHQHNESARAHELVARMQTEKINIALVSDAGTPCISDPGGILVAQAAQNNIEVIAVPGPCAVAAALSICGFPFTTFTFSGFAPRDRKGLEAFCTQIKAAQSDLFVFYESPMRIVKTLQTMSTALPGAHMCACNDLTKRHERAYRGEINDILRKLAAAPNADLGEYTVVVKPAPAPQTAEKKLWPEAALVQTMVERNCTLRQAVAFAAEEGAHSKNALYEASLRLKEML